MPKSLFVPPDGAAVLDGFLIPGASYLKELIDQLRLDVADDAALRTRFQDNPRDVLGERGIVRLLQDEILRELGLAVPEAAEKWCISTGSCCCQTLQ
jgi:hypothetical protein